MNFYHKRSGIRGEWEFHIELQDPVKVHFNSKQLELHVAMFLLRQYSNLWPNEQRTQMTLKKVGQSHL